VPWSPCVLGEGPLSRSENSGPGSSSSEEGIWSSWTGPRSGEASASAEKAPATRSAYHWDRAEQTRMCYLSAWRRVRARVAAEVPQASWKIFEQRASEVAGASPGPVPATGGIPGCSFAMACSTWSPPQARSLRAMAARTACRTATPSICCPSGRRHRGFVLSCTGPSSGRTDSEPVADASSKWQTSRARTLWRLRGGGPCTKFLSYLILSRNAVATLGTSTSPSRSIAAM
jgi:hypothetical protein